MAQNCIVEEPHALYCSSNIICAITYRRMRWVVHVARVGRREIHKEFWLGNLIKNLVYMGR